LQRFIAKVVEMGSLRKETAKLLPYATIGIAPKIFQAKVFLEKLLPGIVHKNFRRDWVRFYKFFGPKKLGSSWSISRITSRS
jgi:hypothetical protein